MMSAKSSVNKIDYYIDCLISSLILSSDLQILGQNTQDLEILGAPPKFTQDPRLDPRSKIQPCCKTGRAEKWLRRKQTLRST